MKYPGTTAVLISGGVDSAVTVHRLVEQGLDLHLFYIRIGLDTDEGDCSAGRRYRDVLVDSAPLRVAVRCGVASSGILG